MRISPKLFVLASVSVALMNFMFPLMAGAVDVSGLVVVTRHGDRTPIHPFNTSLWPQGLGQLTAEGMRQLFELGDRLRKLPEMPSAVKGGYQRELVHVRSTDIDRTLMSAQSLLLGVFPPGSGPQLAGAAALPHGLQPVPIHTMPTVDDTLLLPFDLPCARLEQLREKVKTSEEWRAKEAEVAPLIANITAAVKPIAGNDFEFSLEKWTLACDALVCRKAHGLPTLISDADFDAMLAVEDWRFNHWFSKDFSKFIGGNLLRSVRDDLQGMVSGDRTQKFVLYSAHDSTLASLLASLGSPQGVPPYASAVVFAVVPMTDGEVGLRVTLNGAPLDTPLCDDTCTMSSFWEASKDLFFENWEEACAATEETSTGQTSRGVMGADEAPKDEFGVGSIVLFVLLVVALAAVVAFAFIRLNPDCFKSLTQAVERRVTGGNAVYGQLEPEGV